MSNILHDVTIDLRDALLDARDSGDRELLLQVSEVAVFLEWSCRQRGHVQLAVLFGHVRESAADSLIGVSSASAIPTDEAIALAIADAGGG